MLKGNKGEWAEVYTLVSLLAEGRLYAADSDLEKIEDVFYPIVRIIRNEVENNSRIVSKEYECGEVIRIFIDCAESSIKEISQDYLLSEKTRFFRLIKNGKGKSFGIPEADDLLKVLSVEKIKARSNDKSDIRLIVHDLNTGKKPKLGFSIKALIGKDSTLFNPSPGTNFIFKISPPKGKKLDINHINNLTLQESSQRNSKISLRLMHLLSLGCNIQYHDIQSDNLKQNLYLIDSRLPEILAYLLYYKYLYKQSSIAALCDILEKKNPLNFDLSKGHPFYKHKIKSLLTDSALGMTPETRWEGIYDATGGIIIVKDTGDVLCYHIYNRNEFQEYLYNHTRLEQASTGEDKQIPGTRSRNPKSKKYYFGWIYEKEDGLYLKLNLQIRFKG